MAKSEFSACLFEMFRQIKVRCETERPDCSSRDKYADLVRFVESFEWIRNEFFNWDEELYEQIGLDNIDYDQTIDFDVIYKELRRFTQMDRDTFFKFYIKSINEDTELYEIALKYVTSGSCDENHKDFFDMIMKALGNSRSLNSLRIYMEGGFFADKLLHVCHVKNLYLNVKITSQELREYCRKSLNLSSLLLMNDELGDKLANTMIDDKNLQNLTSLNFQMKPNIDAAVYAPLAKLRSLKYLDIHGIHEIGSLSYLFNGFAAKTFYRNLRELTIHDANMSDEECQAISNIKSLKKLTCPFIEPESIGHLSKLSELSYFRIKSDNKVSKIIPELLKIIRATKNGIQIHLRNDKIEYTKANEILVWTPEKQRVDVSQYVAIFDTPRLRIIGEEYIIKKLFDEFVKKIPQTLQNLEFESTELYCPRNCINHDFFLQILAMNLINHMRNGFPYLCKIYVLAELPQIEELSINIKRGLATTEAEAFKKLFIALASKQISTLKSLNLSDVLIDAILLNELVKIKSLKSLKCSLIEDENIMILNNNTQLKKVVIKIHNISDWILRNAPEIIFQTLTTHKSIQILDMLGNSITYNSFSKKPKLQLTLSRGTDVKPFAVLGSFEDCHSLVVNGHRKLDSFDVLLQSLSMRRENNLKLLQIENYSIDFEETVLISKIKSIEQLICTFSDPKNFEIIHPNTYYKEIKLMEKKFSNEILGFLNNSEGKVIIKSEEYQITYFKRQAKIILEKFYWRSVDVSELAYLGHVDNLKILQINADHQDNSMKKFLTDLAPCTGLKELILKRGIGSDEMLEIAKMTMLRKLQCGFFRSPNFETLSQLKELQELTITNKYGSLQKLFEGISSQASPILQFLSIKGNEITLDELKAIACIKSLKKLKCIIANTDNMEALPTLPHLTELFINSHREGTLLNKLELFSNSALDIITISGDPLNDQDMAALAQRILLKQLHIDLRQLGSMDLLSSLKQLEELNVNLIDYVNSLEASPNLPKYPENLRKVVIRNRSIGIEDIINILQLPVLKSFDFILDGDENAQLGELGQLVELIVTPKRGSLKRILRPLAENPATILKHIVINDVFLDPEESYLLSQISSLITLECKFMNDKSFHYLTQLTNLEELKITAIANYIDVPKQLLNIIKECIKLVSIKLNHEFIDQIGCDFLYDALDVAKTYRNPIHQKPLTLIVGGFLPTYENILSPIDNQYLTIYSEDN